METLNQFIEQNFVKWADNVYSYEKIDGKWVPTTYREALSAVHEYAAGLMEMGAGRGTKIALLSEGRNAWTYSDMAVVLSGATNVPLSIKLEESNDLLFRIQHSGCTFAIASAYQLPKIRTVQPDCPLLKTIIVLDDFVNEADRREGEVTMSEVIALGRKALADKGEGFLKERIESVQPDDWAAISYTSGTTSNPKGVILTQKNLVSNTLQATQVITMEPEDKMLLILPLDHCYAHVAGLYIPIFCGASVATVPGVGTEILRNIPIAIKETAPQVILSVPALLKNFKKNIENGIKAKGPKVVALYNFALKLSISYWKDGYNHQGICGLWKRPLMALFDKLIFTQVRANFGGKFKFFSGGGAYLDVATQRYFRAIGMPVYQGYGLSEASPIISSNNAAYPVFGSTGHVLPGIEVSIRDLEGNEMPVGEKGEIVVKGPNVMAGYFKNPEATAETIEDGWLHTGDMGYVTDKNILYVEGRFKSLLIGADGEKYSPEGIEGSLTSTSKFIEQVILHDSQDPYVIALIVPNTAALKAYLAKEFPKVAWGSEEARTACVNAIVKDVNEYRKGGKYADLFPIRWIPGTVVILPEPFTEKNHMLNSTMKIVRNKVEAFYKDRIAYAYTAEGKDPLNADNLKSIINE